MPEQQPAQHHNPEIKRWFVSVGQSVVVECEYMSVRKGLVRYAEIPQLVGRREIPRQHHRKKADESEDEDRHHRMAGEYVALPRL